MKIIFTLLIFTLFNHKIKCPEVLLSGEGHMELSSNVDISNKYHDNFYQINSFNQLNSQNQFQECDEKCEGFYHCETKIKKCVHKGVFPIYPSELIQLIIIIGISMVATSVGIGGGGVYCAIIMYVENFKPYEAYPISIFLIAICSFSTYYNGVQDKLKHPDNNFVDYDIAIVFCPTLLLGAKLGAIFNKTISNSVLMLLLFAFGTFIIYKTYGNLKKQIEKEKSLETEAISKSYPSSNNQYSLLKKKLIDDSFTSSRKSSLLDELEREFKHNTTIVSKEIIEEEKKPVRFDRIKYLFIFQLISIIDQFIEGNKRVPSFIGLTQCSTGYWFVFILYIGVSIYLVKFSHTIIKRNYEYKLTLSKDFVDPKYEYLEKNWNRVVIITILGGIISGMLGIGGGNITTPLMLGMGIDPKAATSTSNFLILVTTTISTIIFILADQLNLNFCLFLSIPSAIAAFWGSSLINQYINRTKKTSILLIGIIFVLIISNILLIINSYDTIQKEAKSSVFDLFYVKKFC